MTQLSDVSFFNDFVSSLPGDSSGDKTPRLTPKVCYSLVQPTPVPDPKIVITSQNLKDQFLWEINDSAENRALLSGSLVPKSSKPFSLCYGGHQFGHWAGQLGDGRAITLGEVKDRNGKAWELQLKGAGLTPYSRTADGKAVFRSSLREFLASEAMFHLGVPTTRALSLTTTGEEVLRDMFYTGDIKPEPGAVVARMAPTFLRFGNFEILAAQGEVGVMKMLLHWVIDRHFPEISQEDEVLKFNQWFRTLAERTALMVSEWLRVGFVHGVMNTDNMSVLGLTIDYGPYGWLEEYEPSWTPNTTDLPGRRYCFGRQASIAFWNLQCLASALNVLPKMEEGLKDGLEHFHISFEKHLIQTMSHKLGIPGLSLAKDHEFLQSFEGLLKDLHVDMSLFYRRLADWRPDLDINAKQHARHQLVETMYIPLTSALENKLDQWLNRYGDLILESEKIGASHLQQRRDLMNRTNPKYILRNSMALKAIEVFEKENDTSLIQEIFTLLKNPYDEQPQFEKWAVMRPEWAVDLPGSSTLSCSS